MDNKKDYRDDNGVCIAINGDEELKCKFYEPCNRAECQVLDCAVCHWQLIGDCERPD